MPDKPKSNLVLIREFFGMSLAEMKEQVMGKITKDEIALIGEGIRNGSLTY